MKKKRSRIAHLSRPLIATVAAAAPIAGCYGGDYSPDDGPGDGDFTGDGDYTGDGDFGGDGDATVTECPELFPGVGAACGNTDESLACQYDADPCPHYLRCYDGRWQQAATCNPPPPDYECPPEVPTQGDPCATDDYCWYGEPCAEEYGASCVNGGWVVEPVLSSCNPPPPDYDAGL